MNLADDIIKKDGQELIHFMGTFESIDLHNELASLVGVDYSKVLVVLGKIELLFGKTHRELTEEAVRYLASKQVDHD